MASDTAYELLVSPDGTSWAARENLHDVLRRSCSAPPTATPKSPTRLRTRATSSGGSPGPAHPDPRGPRGRGHQRHG